MSSSAHSQSDHGSLAPEAQLEKILPQMIDVDSKRMRRSQCDTGNNSPWAGCSMIWCRHAETKWFPRNCVQSGV